MQQVKQWNMCLEIASTALHPTPIDVHRARPLDMNAPKPV